MEDMVQPSRVLEYRVGFPLDPSKPGGETGDGKGQRGEKEVEVEGRAWGTGISARLRIG